MFTITEKKQLHNDPGVFLYRITAPRIAKKRKTGQFIILRASETAERIPLTIVNSNPGDGTITIVFQVVGKGTILLSALNEGDTIADVAGPLGMPTELENFGRVVCIGGGIGAAPLYPIVKGLKDCGNTVTSIIGARTKELIILEKEMTALSDEIHICTDDGTYGTKGFVTNVLEDLLAKGEKFDHAFAIGPVIMMKAVCGVTKKFSIPTTVSLNPIMVDGTGMCGGCRVSVGGEKKFACVDGPEFDGHLVDFDELMHRLSTYKDHENHGKEKCKIGL